MSLVEITRGESPLLLGLPHTGTDLPDEVAAALNETGLARADTDWHVQALYAGLADDIAGGVTSVRTTVHRYAIDVNRDPAGTSLYPGQNTTGLVPLTDFDGRPIWRAGHEPDAAEIDRRRRAWHAPYHAALGRELDRLRARHGYAILYDCHSIRGEIPYLFPGKLPDFNIGTNDGTSCAPGIETLVAGICADAPGYSHVRNGRFKGGWTTRHYGRPRDGLHAIQMELAQSTYLAAEAPPWAMDPARAGRLRRHLGAILSALANWSPP